MAYEGTERLSLSERADAASDVVSRLLRCLWRCHRCRLRTCRGGEGAKVQGFTNGNNSDHNLSRIELRDQCIEGALRLGIYRPGNGFAVGTLLPIGGLVSAHPVPTLSFWRNLTAGVNAYSFGLKSGRALSHLLLDSH